MNTKTGIAIETFLYYQWIEEDDDGLNLVIMTSRRNEIEIKFKEQMAEIQELSIDENGVGYYLVNDLVLNWNKVYTPPTEKDF
ncbi:MAG: hypothetical protein ACR2HF_01205 [Methylococcaceae bacterium]